MHKYLINYKQFNPIQYFWKLCAHWMVMGIFPLCFISFPIFLKVLFLYITQPLTESEIRTFNQICTLMPEQLLTDEKWLKLATQLEFNAIKHLQ